MNFNHYFSNEELSALLTEWEKAYPNLVRVSSIGNSHEGRPLLLVTITNLASGTDLEKPAVWIDSNIHATEITGTTAALYIIHHLLSGYGNDDQATRLLDRCVYYIFPRVNPDGAEWAMSAKPRYVRSGVRPYPWEDKEEGLQSQDINGDGKILQMRYQDPNGDWKISSLDSRLMEKRAPDDRGGRTTVCFPKDFWKTTMAISLKLRGHSKVWISIVISLLNGDQKAISLELDHIQPQSRRSNPW